MKKFLLIVLCFLGSISSKATHIVGGGFSYQMLSQNEAKFTLTLYFDYINGSIGAKDQYAICHIFRKFDNQYMDSLFMPLSDSSRFLPYTNPGCGATANLKTQVLTYSTNFFMDPSVYNSAKGYYLVWERCCRNNIITNIMEPDASGQTFYMEFPPVFKSGQPFVNSSPQFLPILADFPCVNQDFSLSFSAIDPDGDLLVYSLTNPLKGNSTNITPRGIAPVPAPYDPVVWIPGFGADFPIPGNPGLSVNPQTGLLSCKATLTGLFVFSVKCEEFRNGIKIGEVRKEMQLPVVDCPPNDPPEIILKNTAGIQLGQDDTLYLESRQENFCIPLKLTDFQQMTRLKFNLDVISGPENLQSSNLYLIDFESDSASAVFCFPPCTVTPPGEVWKIRLRATDNGCPDMLADTLNLSLVIQPEDYLPELRIFSDWTGGSDIQLSEREKITFQVGAEVSDGGQIYLLPAGSLSTQPGYSFPEILQGPGRVTGDLVFDPGCDGTAGVYDIQFFARANGNCSQKVLLDTLQFSVQLNKEPDSLGIVPNLITLNGDGLNEVLSLEKIAPRSNCANEFDFVEIFNRWGRRIFFEKSRDFVWKPDELTEGLFFYSLHFKRRKPLSSWIQVVKGAPSAGN